MSHDWTFHSKLRAVIAEGKKYGIDVTEVTVSPDVHRILIAEVMATARSYDTNINSRDMLRVYETVIRKRECKGCCSHG